MSESNPELEALAKSYLEVWRESFSQVLSQVAGAAVTVTLPQAADTLASAETDSFLMVAATGSLRGEMMLRLPRASALVLAQLLLSEKPDPAAEFKPDHRDAAEEFVRQVAGHVTTAIKPLYGETQLRVDAGEKPAWSPAAAGCLQSAEPAPFQIEWQVSAALAAALHPAEKPAAATAAMNNPDGKLDLLLDVGLEVSLRFGGRRMLLREILELGAGSVVELDRQVEEPAELLLDGKLIARGEVVLVDGNYGLRVTELVNAVGGADRKGAA
jgi:flagellar motor switch protein FliN/FliY